MKFKLESILPFVVLGPILLLMAGLGWVFFSSSSNPLSRIAGQKEPYMPKFSDPQTYQPEESDKFVFQYPPKFNLTSQPLEGGGKRILVESTEPKKGFEITILPFDEDIQITADRIRQDIPGIVMENVRELTPALSLSKRGSSPPFTKEGEKGEFVPALAFNSVDENIGPTFEIWFVHEGELYQALTYPEFAGEMEEILKTWKFK